MSGKTERKVEKKGGELNQEKVQNLAKEESHSPGEEMTC